MKEFDEVLEEELEEELAAVGFIDPDRLRLRLRITIGVSLAVITALIVLNFNSYFELRSSKAYAKSVESSYNGKNKELNSKLNTLDSDLVKLQDKYYEEKLTQIMSQEKLAVLAKDAWTYTLKVNGAEFKENYISTKDRDISIVLTEIKDSKKPLPSNVINVGSITGSDKSDKFFDHLMLQTTAPYEKNVKTEGDISKATYTFKNLPAGTIITLNLSEPLKERMKINENMLEVISK